MKKKDVRTERRIDYTKNEIAQALNVSENTVDYRIKKLCEFYGIEPSIFKRNYGENRNFFPIDYVSLLILLLKSCEINPSIKKKKIDVNAKDVADYNTEMLNEIDTNKYLPDYLREIVNNMPWYREAKDIIEWSEILVEELTQLIINLTKLKEGDIGQTIKYICRELDYMNYYLYRKSYIISEVQSDNDNFKKQIEEYLYQSILNMSDEERANFFRNNPENKLFYNAYIHTKSNIPYIDKMEFSIDKGILAIMEALMAGMGLKELQNIRVDKLPEFLNEEEYKNFCTIMNKNAQVSDSELLECERKLYLNNQEDAVKKYINMHLKKPGSVDMLFKGKKWKSIIKKIEEGIYFEDYHEAYMREYKGGISEEEFMATTIKLNEEKQKDLFEKYLKYYNSNRENNKDLYDIVNRFIGQVMLNYLSVSKEK